MHSDPERCNASVKEMLLDGTNDTEEDAGGNADEPVAL